jgi:hypothetical protein
VTEPAIGQGASGPQATLSRDLADFLIELSIALHKHAMYPEGHPSLAPATGRVIERLNRALVSRASLSLGVARHQLVIEGVATDSKNSVLKDLAGRMHRHHLGAVTFRAGTTPAELHDVLAVLAVEADRSGEPLGLGPRERLNAWPHVRLHPLTYERLDLIEEQPLEEGGADPASREARTRAAQLWLGLARAALAADAAQAAEDSDAATPTDPSLVAEAIEAHPRGTAYDQVIVGYLLQIADEVKGGATLEERSLRGRVSQLITELDTGTLTRLLDMGGDRLQRRQFVLNASDGLAVDAVVDLVKAAGQAEHETVSHSMLRMLSKLAQHTRGPSEQRRVLADQSVREQVAELVRDWSLDDPNPDGYRAALRRVTTSERTGPENPATHPPEAGRLLHMVLELGVTGAPVREAVERLVHEGDLATVTATLASGVPQEVWREFIDSGVIGRVVEVEPLDLQTLDFLLPQAGMAAAEPMLEALMTSESSQTRRALLDRVTALGSPVGPLVVSRLGDARWYVQRNMLVILRELPAVPAGFDARPFAEHGDARVRREAFHLLMGDAARREWAIARALTDADARIVHLGLGAAMQGCPDSAVPLAAALASRSASQELRVMAVRALGAAKSDLAVETLLRLAAPRKSGLWRRRGAPSPEATAAIGALKAFRDRPHVRDALARLGVG